MINLNVFVNWAVFEKLLKFQMKQSGNPQWWKLHEAMMLALGSTQEVLERQKAAGNVNFDLGVYLQNVVLSNIASPGIVHFEPFDSCCFPHQFEYFFRAASPFLFGRCLWIGSKFPAQLPESALPQFLEATVRGLQQGAVFF